MKSYNYFYYGQAIPRAQFIAAVRANWESEVNEFGEFSYGGYRAIKN